ncbi:MAG: hypothetical protein KKA07_03630 [Bacteroidetes bacterium]|nr:hypothetical protein [Bacteroidota bacterium]MBU1718144.1 hypothetical protein [Bacteroidota bacterium]
MNHTIGIRHEDKYVMERRVAITPRHVKRLISAENLKFQVQSSPKRIFSDDEYKAAGAEIVDKLENASVIFGVKEIPLSFFEYGKTYIFFSHVIKGQPYNMPMLKKMMELKCNLIDYEKVEDELNRRLIFFGRFAGLAGMINSFWSLGQRLKRFGYDTPFLNMKQSHKYHSLDEAKADISAFGFEIAKNGLPAELCPLTIGFTGYGNVSNGAQEICHLLPVQEITPGELLTLKNNPKTATNMVYKVVFKEEHLSQHNDSSVEFELSDYYAHPENYTSQFEQYIPHISVLMNCMYWDARYPRIVTKDYLEKLSTQGNVKLTVIGDVTCDPDGSIECTHKGTEIEDPVFVYNPFERKYKMGFDGEGILVMPVDILPSELPREASVAFGDALFRYVKGIASQDFSNAFDALTLPNPIRRAMILHNGELTPSFKYIEKYL